MERRSKCYLMNACCMEDSEDASEAQKLTSVLLQMLMHYERYELPSLKSDSTHQKEIWPMKYMSLVL